MMTSLIRLPMMYILKLLSETLYDYLFEGIEGAMCELLSLHSLLLCINIGYFIIIFNFK